MPADPTANSNRLGPASKRSLGETRQATLSSEPPLDCPFAAPFPALARACLRWRESKPRRAMAASQPKTRCGVRSPGSVKREWRGVECRESRWTPGTRAAWQVADRLSHANCIHPLKGEPVLNCSSPLVLIPLHSHLIPSFLDSKSPCTLGHWLDYRRSCDTRGLCGSWHGECRNLGQP